ncbi:MAG TPA: hypothetical protein VK900_12105 [Anaerolineales bacterium]|nr:hypothetical protein [Anaerolineales bacterium]
MRRRNWRFVGTGLLFIFLAIGFYFFMMTVASASTDPVEVMRIVGGASGTVIGLSTFLILLGLVGKKT